MHYTALALPALPALGQTTRLKGKRSIDEASNPKLRLGGVIDVALEAGDLSSALAYCSEIFSFSLCSRSAGMVLLDMAIRSSP